MNTARVLAILLIVAGGLGLAYGSFTYTRATHTAAIGPLEMSVKDTQTVNVPLWASAAAVGAGVVLFLFGARRR